MSEFGGLYGAYFVVDIAEMRATLTRELVRTGRTAGLVITVFANGSKKFVKEEIFPLVGYWNHRSGDCATFFFVGWKGDPEIGSGDFAPVMELEDFSDRAFVEAIEEFEKNSEWKYEGDTPLIICRSVLKERKQTKERRAFLDLTEMISFPMEKALRERSIDSVESFFEGIIAAAKEIPGRNVSWKLSDKLGTESLGKALVEGIAHKLPGAKELVNAVRFFRIQDKDKRDP